MAATPARSTLSFLTGLSPSLGLCLALGGCDSGPGEIKLARSQQAIRGGRAAPDVTGVVGIAIEFDDGFSLCSGSLIAPNLVLTAQHCVAELSSEYVDCDQDRFGQLLGAERLYVTPDAVMDFEGNGTYYAVSDVQVPQQQAPVCGYDIALLTLAQPMSGVTPRIPRLDDYPASNELFDAVGYGHTGNEIDSGVRRIIEDRQWLCVGPDCVGVEGVTSTELVGNDGTCQGDSGGPAIDAQGRVLGALSRGGDVCTYPTYAAAAAWGDWIRDAAVVAAQRGGYSPPSWAGGQVDPDPDPVADDFDGDGWPDDQDNCPGVANADQGDLDEDGQGDACDGQLDRACTVCEPCSDDAACGPGGTCTAQGVCVLSCNTHADCPGAGTTQCLDVGGVTACVNADALTAGLCPTSFVCGQGGAPGDGAGGAGGAGGEDEGKVPGPVGGDAAPGGGLIPPPAGDPLQSSSTRQARFEGGCDLGGASGGAWWILALLGLGGIRRRRR